jgi:hypothetical protein
MSKMGELMERRLDDNKYEMYRILTLINDRSKDEDYHNPELQKILDKINKGDETHVG